MMANKIVCYGICLISSFFSPLYAAKPIPLANTTFNTIKNNFKVDIPQLNNTFPQASNPNSSLSRNSLKYIKENKGVNKTHIRLYQQYSGFPVYGGYAIFHKKNNLINNNNTEMSGVLYSGIESDLGNPNVDFVKNKNLALQHYKGQHPGEVKKEEVTPIVYIDANSKAFWAYKVSLLIVQPGDIPERPTAIINAKDFTPFVEWNDMKTINIPAEGEKNELIKQI